MDSTIRLSFVHCVYFTHVFGLVVSDIDRSVGEVKVDRLISCFYLSF